jgi:ABC-2 type transport system permease protein
MGIFTNNPVLEREVRGRLRWKRKGSVQANRWIGGLLGLIVSYYYVRSLAGLWHGTVQDARDFWPLLVYGTLTLIVLLAPALSATAITQEREQQTWENLATTQLSASEVLLGKWLGRQLIPWLLILILLPYMAVCVLRAGLGGLMLPAVLAFLLVTTGCYSAIGLLCSFRARRTVTATAVSLTVAALLCVGTVIINQVYALLVYHGIGSPESPVLWVNPFYAIGSMISQISPVSGSINSDTDLAAPAWYFLIMIAINFAALTFMVRHYNQSVQGN